MAMEKGIIITANKDCYGIEVRQNWQRKSNMLSQVLLACVCIDDRPGGGRPWFVTSSLLRVAAFVLLACKCWEMLNGWSNKNRLHQIFDKMSVLIAYMSNQLTTSFTYSAKSIIIIIIITGLMISISCARLIFWFRGSEYNSIVSQFTINATRYHRPWANGHYKQMQF